MKHFHFHFCLLVKDLNCFCLVNLYMMSLNLAQLWCRALDWYLYRPQFHFSSAMKRYYFRAFLIWIVQVTNAKFCQNCMVFWPIFGHVYHSQGLTVLRFGKYAWHFPKAELVWFYVNSNQSKMKFSTLKATGSTITNCNFWDHYYVVFTQSSGEFLGRLFKLRHETIVWTKVWSNWGLRASI